MQFEDFAPVIPDTTREIAINEDKARDNFNRLYSLDLREKCENKNGLTYLSWSYSWAEFKKVYPTATYRVIKNPATNLPYFSDPNVGIMVFTEVTADGITHSMWLPVMDAANRSMREVPYTYQVWDKTNHKYIEKKVEAVSMFDINKSLMRCLTKNLAMFGCGLYIFAGEDVPEQLPITAETIESPVTGDMPNVPFLQDDQPQKQTRRRKSATPPADPFAGIKTIIANTDSMKELVDLYLAHKQVVDSEPSLLEAFTQRKIEINNQHAA